MERAEAPTWVTFKSVISPLIIITSGAYVQTDRDRPGERAAWLVEGSEIDRWRVVERGDERGKKKNEIWWAEGCCWAFVRGRLKFIQSNQPLNLTLSARPLFCSHTHTHIHTHSTTLPCYRSQQRVNSAALHLWARPHRNNVRPSYVLSTANSIHITCALQTTICCFCIHPPHINCFLYLRHNIELRKLKSSWFDRNTLLKIKVLYWHLWFHKEPLTSMEAFHNT